LQNLKNNLSVIGESLLGLFYPRLCPACSEVLYGNENILCLKCIIEFPRTNYQFDPENDMARLFWGRVRIDNAAAFFYYQKGSRFQNLIHEMKYFNQQQLGTNLGYWFGMELTDTPFRHADIIHPVPLHAFKMKKRGYNQSEKVARGLSEALGIPMETTLIERIVNTDTQTRKTKYERWSNVEGIFRVTDPDKVAKRHVILVDDVVTTGSTLEACAIPVLALEGTSVSVLTLGFAKLG
jgi:ComF family protein